MRTPPLHAASAGTETFTLPSGDLVDMRAALLTSRGICLALLGVERIGKYNRLPCGFRSNGDHPVALTKGLDRADGNTNQIGYPLISFAGRAQLSDPFFLLYGHVDTSKAEIA